MKFLLPAVVAVTCTTFSSSPASADVLLETDFSNTTLYPSNKALGTVADQHGTWAFNGSARAVELEGGKRAINMVDANFNVYTFTDIYTSGTISVEFSFMTQDTRALFDIQLANGTADKNIGPQLRFGANGAGDVSYYDGTAFVTIPGASFVVGAINTFTLTAFLSGEHAGKFNLYLNGTPVGEDLIWRNNISSLSSLRMRPASNGTSRTVDLTGLTITYEAIPEPSSAALGFMTLALFGGVSGAMARRRAA